MTGDVHIHDPSVIEIDGQFVALGTGQQGPTHGAIRAKTSPDGVKWTDAGVIGQGPPAWARAALGFQPLNVWAPSISRRGKTVFLYYCLSSFGRNTSAIGLMTNTSFDPLKPGEGWQDQGLVLMSKDGDDFNAIDPFRVRFVGRARLSRLRLVLVRDQAQRAQPGNRQAHPGGCAAHSARQSPRRRDRSRLDPRA